MKTLAIIVLAIGSWAMMTWAEFTKHPVAFYIGLTIAGILVLGALVWASKKIAKFIGWSLSSCVYLVLAITVLSILGFNNILPSGVGVVSGVLLGGLLVVMGIRRVATKAQVSLFWGELFAWATGYQLRNLIQGEKFTEITKATKVKADRETVVGALTALGFTKTEAEEATDYAIENHPEETPENLVKSALTYLKSNKLDK